MTFERDEEATPVDYKIILPPGWVRLPLQENTAEAIALLARRHAARFAVGQQESGRQALVRVLEQAVRQAREAAGIDLLLSIEPVLGQAVPASCLVSYFEPDDPWTGSVEDLLGQLTSEGMTVEVRDLDMGAVVRRAGTRVEPLSDPTDDPTAAEPPLVLTEVGYWVRVPGRRGLLALNFSTPVEELAESLTALFDAMAETFWWVRA